MNWATKGTFVTELLQPVGGRYGRVNALQDVPVRWLGTRLVLESMLVYFCLSVGTIVRPAPFNGQELSFCFRSR